MKFCSNCVIPETAETHSFSSDGSCSVCNQIDIKKSKIDWKNRKLKLEELIKNYRGKFTYDCIIPFSGGKDSVFALWYAIKKLELKPLVVRFNHLFMRETVEKNVEKCLKKLGADFIDFRPDSKIVKKMMIETLIRRGDFCWHCHTGVTAYPLKIAIEKSIPLILYGEPSAEYSSFYDYDDFEELTVEKFNRNVNLGINAEDIVGMLNERFPHEKVGLRDVEPWIFPDQRTLNVKKIKATYLGNYISWDVRKQVEIIKRELDWEGDEVEGIPEQYDYEKIECVLQGLRDYTKYLKRGFGRTSHLTSIDIRNDRMKREEAVELVRNHDGYRPHALDYFLKITGMTEDEYYETVLRHVVAPHKPEDINTLKSRKSNKKPKDFDNFFKKTF